MSAERRKQKEGPAQLPTAWPGSTREACGNHRRTHWHIASNRSLCNHNFVRRSATCAPVGESNGTGALMKPVVGVARIYRTVARKIGADAWPAVCVSRREVAIEIAADTG